MWPGEVNLELQFQNKMREPNSNGPYIGLITVYPPEENAFFATSAFKPHSKYPFLDLSEVGNFDSGRYEGRKQFSNTGYLHIKGIIHFGISGITNSSMNIGDVSIPSQFVNTSLWDWLKPNATIPSNDAATLEIRNYNVPKEGNNSLGHIGYSPEQFYSEAGEPNTAQQMVWFNVTNNWLQLASPLKELELEQYVNSSLCLENKPKVVIGVKGSTSNIFVDNAAYRDFLFQTFGVSTADVESTAIIMTNLSNGFPIIYSDTWTVRFSSCRRETKLNYFVRISCRFKWCTSCHSIFKFVT